MVRGRASDKGVGLVVRIGVGFGLAVGVELWVGVGFGV